MNASEILLKESANKIHWQHPAFLNVEKRGVERLDVFRNKVRSVLRRFSGCNWRKINDKENNAVEGS